MPEPLALGCLRVSPLPTERSFWRPGLRNQVQAEPEEPGQAGSDCPSSRQLVLGAFSGENSSVPSLSHSSAVAYGNSASLRLEAERRCPEAGSSLSPACTHWVPHQGQGLSLLSLVESPPAGVRNKEQVVARGALGGGVSGSSSGMAVAEAGQVGVGLGCVSCSPLEKGQQALGLQVWLRVPGGCLPPDRAHRRSPSGQRLPSGMCFLLSRL